MLVYFWTGTTIQEVNYFIGGYPPNELKGRTCVFLAQERVLQYRDWTSQGWRITNPPDIPKELRAFALLLS